MLHEWSNPPYVLFGLFILEHPRQVVEQVWPGSGEVAGWRLEKTEDKPCRQRRILGHKHNEDNSGFRKTILVLILLEEKSI